MQIETLINDQPSPSLIHLAFQDHDVRAMPDISKLWIWAAAIDVFEAAGRSWAGRRSIKNLPKEWVRVVRCATPQGLQDTYFIAEPAIYSIFSNSKTEKGQRFYRWIFEEVLPNLRVNGFFGAYSPAEQFKNVDQVMKLVERMDAGSNAVVDALYPIYVQCCTKIRIKPLPMARFKNNQLEMEGL